ncbi:MAG: type II secretion system F family protein [Nocardioides sp.]|nr:type II secretion system F family protein [Nocardioides sp.]
MSGVVVAAALAAAAVAALVPRGRRRLPWDPPPVATEDGAWLRRHLWLWMLGAGGGTYLLLGGGLGLLAGAAAAAGVARVVRTAEMPATRRRREEVERALPAVVDLTAAALRAGAAPHTALGVVGRAWGGPVEEELARVERRLLLGADPGSVWRDLAGHPQLGPLGRALSRAHESGASVATALHQLAEETRRTARADVEGRARSVAAKAAAPLGVCMLPAFVLVGVVPMVVAMFAATGLGDLLQGP